MPTGKEPKKLRRGSSFRALTDYIRDAEKTQGNVWVINCLSIGSAAAGMSATALQNKRCNYPGYHGIITWPSDEKPTPEQAKEAGIITLKELGFDVGDCGHQAMIALHRDTDNWHIHIAANKVHPETLKPLHIHYSHERLHAACREVEIKQGWSNQNGLMEVTYDVDGEANIVKSSYRNERNRGVSQQSLDYEKHAGVFSFERYMFETVGPSLKEELKAKSTWQSIHKLLNEFNVKIVERGGGFAFADQPLFRSDFTEDQKLIEVQRAGTTHSAAGKVGYFARGSALIKILGAFEANKVDLGLPKFRYNQRSEFGREQLEANGQQVIRELSQKDKDEGRLKAKFDKAMLERKAVFTLKKEKRKSDLTDIKKNEERELQVQLNVSRIKAHAANAQLPPGSRLSTPDVNAILRAERDKLKSELKAKQVARQKAFDEEFDALEKKLQKHNSYHRWLADQSKLDDEHGDLAKHLYMESKMREQIDKQKRIEQGGETFQAPAVNPNIQSFLSISKDVEKLGYKAYDNKTHIAYVRIGDYKVKFKDYGSSISISNQEDKSIRDAMVLAIQKWGKVIKVNGSPEFQAKAAKIAFESGVENIQSDDKQALEIFWALKESRAAIDLAKQQADAITAHSLVDNEKYLDYSDREACDKLNKAANLLKIAEKYGYSIEKQKDNAVRLLKGNKILNIAISSDTDVFFMKCPLGFDISGTAQDFIRQEEYLSYADAAQRLFILNRSFPKNVQAEANKAYDVAYVRHLFNTASNNTDSIASLANKGLYRHDLGKDSRINDNGEIFFAHRNAANDIIGFEIKSKENSPMWFVKGGQKGVYSVNDITDFKIKRVVVTFDAIEAELLKKMEVMQDPSLLKRTLYLSIGGAVGKRQIEHLKRYEQVAMELHVTQSEVINKAVDTLKNALEHIVIVYHSEKLIMSTDLYGNRDHFRVMV